MLLSPLSLNQWKLAIQTWTFGQSLKLISMTARSKRGMGNLPLLLRYYSLLNAYVALVQELVVSLMFGAEVAGAS